MARGMARQTVGVPRRPAWLHCRWRRSGRGCGSSTTGWMRGSRLEGARRRSPGARDRGAARPVPEEYRRRTASRDGGRHRGDGVAATGCSLLVPEASRAAWRPWPTSSTSWPALPGDGSPPCSLAAHWSGGLATHATSLGALVGGTSLVWTRAMRSIEAGAAADEPVLGDDVATRWLGPTLSGWPGQPRALGDARQGRAAPHGDLRASGSAGRATARRARPLHRDRHGGTGGRSTGPGVRGLDSAPTAQERVDLALAEMERTGAFDRSLLVLVSPTGLGYVNYVAMAAAQYLTAATSHRSPCSTPTGRPRCRSAGWHGLASRTGCCAPGAGASAPPGGAAPRSSCSARASGRTPARTSSCTGAPWAWRRSASTGPVDRHPHGSGWMHEVTGPDRLDVDRRSVAVVNDLEQPVRGLSAGCTRGTSC